MAALGTAKNHCGYGLSDRELRKARMAAWGAVPSTVALTDSTKLAASAAAQAAVATTNIDTNLIERTTQDAVRAAARNVWVAAWFAVWGAVHATLEAVPSDRKSVV